MDKLQFLQLFCECKSFTQAAETLGVSVTTLYNHVEHDPWFAEQVLIVKRKLAWGLVPRQYERALQNSCTDAIWLQKVLGGAEFNPDRAPSLIHAQTVNIAYMSSLRPPPTMSYNTLSVKSAIPQNQPKLPLESTNAMDTPQAVSAEIVPPKSDSASALPIPSSDEGVG